MPDLEVRVLQLQQTIDRVMLELEHLERANKLPPEATAPDVLLSDDQFAALVGCSKMTLLRMRKLGEMPPLVRYAPNRQGTRLSHYREWLSERTAPK